MRGDGKIEKGKNKLLHSFKYALAGIFASFKTEKNMKIHILIMALVILAGFIFKISQTEWMICILLFGIVIAGEIFNTAIEIVVDMVMPHQNKKAKLAKDLSAGAVLILAIAAAIIGFMIFIPRMI